MYSGSIWWLYEYYLTLTAILDYPRNISSHINWRSVASSLKNASRSNQLFSRKTDITFKDSSHTQWRVLPNFCSFMITANCRPHRCYSRQTNAKFLRDNVWTRAFTKYWGLIRNFITPLRLSQFSCGWKYVIGFE